MRLDRMRCSLVETISVVKRIRLNRVRYFCISMYRNRVEPCRAGLSDDQSLVLKRRLGSEVSAMARQMAAGIATAWACGNPVMPGGLRRSRSRSPRRRSAIGGRNGRTRVSDLVAQHLGEQAGGAVDHGRLTEEAVGRRDVPQPVFGFGADRIEAPEFEYPPSTNSLASRRQLRRRAKYAPSFT